jgi:hypothetical protein
MKNRKKYLMMEVVKTALWVCGFAAIGYLAVEPLLKGKSPEPAATVAAGDDSYLIGRDNPRVKELSREYKEITFNNLSDFYYYTPEPGEKPDPALMSKSSIPNDIKALNGKKISLSGFMMPIDQDAEGSREFVLNGNFDMCGFGGPTSINQWVVVKYTGNGKVPYTHLPMTIFGELEVGEDYRDGSLFSIYRMKAKAASTPQGLIE